MEVSDEALILACRRSDQAAWEALIARYQRLVYSIPRRAGLDAQQAADVFQQVFASLVEHLHHIEHPARIGPWLVITARRETWRVSRGRIPAWSPVEGEDDGASGQIADESPLPDEVALRQERREQVRQAMTALGEPCRTLLLMLFFRPEPPPYAQIAAALGTSEGSIGPTRARCLQKIARLLDESVR
jgi:RNA polymerase sigma factor (sigma-70 family)